MILLNQGRTVYHETVVKQTILLLALACLLLTGILRADDAPILSGSKVETKDAVARSNAVFVGELIKLGGGIAARSISPTFLGNDVKVLQVLRGSVEGHILVSLSISGPAHEEPPAEGENYIFFVHKTTQGESLPFSPFGDVIKLLSATDTNIAAVKKLIAQLPAK